MFQMLFNMVFNFKRNEMSDHLLSEFSNLTFAYYHPLSALTNQAVCSFLARSTSTATERMTMAPTTKGCQ